MAKVSNETRLVATLFRERIWELKKRTEAVRAGPPPLRSQEDYEAFHQATGFVKGIETAQKALDNILLDLEEGR